MEGEDEADTVLRCCWCGCVCVQHEPEAAVRAAPVASAASRGVLASGAAAAEAAAQLEHLQTLLDMKDSQIWSLKEQVRYRMQCGRRQQDACHIFNQ